VSQEEEEYGMMDERRGEALAYDIFREFPQDFR
jgi:hypothetical protein